MRRPDRSRGRKRSLTLRAAPDTLRVFLFASERNESRLALDATSIHEILSGHRRGPVAALTRCGLACLEPIYRLAVQWRNRRYDRNPERSLRVERPVISVGNLTTGGTGKTPFVLWLAQRLQASGRHPVVLSRGYKGLAGGANDEALELHSRAPGLVHLQGADRVALATQAISQHAAEVLILDDGFQHRRLHRDLDIVLIDATLPFGYGHLLPRGLLREPLSALRRADVVVLNRSDLVPPEELARIQHSVAGWAPDAPRCLARQSAECLRGIEGVQQPLAALRSGKWYAFAAIGNPSNFQATLQRLGCELAGFLAFPDHHAFTAEDLIAIRRAAAATGADQLVCTGKDLVKIDASAGEGFPLWALQTSLEIAVGGESLQQKIAAALNSVHVCS